MRRNTRDKAKKQHEFLFDQTYPFAPLAPPNSGYISDYADYASFSDIAVETSFDDETIEAIEALKKASASYGLYGDW